MEGLPLPRADKLADISKKLDFTQYVAEVRDSSLLRRHFVWNHGKILAVNGKTMMTGGGNYWSDYTGTQHDIIDQ